MRKALSLGICLMLLTIFFASFSIGVSAFKYKWTQVSEEGFGDLTNDYAWAMANYTVDGTEYLYVGTLNTNFSGGGYFAGGAEVWRTNGTDADDDGIYDWECVVGPGGQAKKGFADFTGGAYPLFGVRGMTKHAGLLWAGTMPIADIFVTNGTTWKRANLPGFGDPENISSTRGITVYEGKIYAEAQDANNGVRIFRYDGSINFDSINPMNWKQVNINGFDSIDPTYNIGIGELIPFDGYLYAGTWTTDAFGILETTDWKGLEIWRTDGTENLDGTLVWENVVGRYAPIGPGFDDDNNGLVMSVEIFNDELYVGTQNFGDLAEIWRTIDGITWEPVVLSGFHRLNLYMWRMIAYSGKLFVGTMNPFTGCQIWMSETGNPDTFHMVNVHGMDGSMSLMANVGAFVGHDDGPYIPFADQYGVRSVSEFDGNLMVGTASFGDWVDSGFYQMTNGKWDTLSPTVGCEIWNTNTSQTYEPSGLTVDKTVWDPSSGQWVNHVDAVIGDTVRFRCEMHYEDTYPLSSLEIYDFLSSSLEYADDATFYLPNGTVLPLEPHGMIDVTIMDYDLGTAFWWNFDDTITLELGDTIVLELNARVVKCGRLDLNLQFIRGYCEEVSEWSFGCDYALVKALCAAGPVGGIIVPVDKLGLLTPYISIAFLTIMISMIAIGICITGQCVKYRKKK